MAINIDTLVHNEFSRSATGQLEKIIGKPENQVRSGVDRAVTEILDNLSLMAREESGRQTIYEASRYSDDGLIDDPAIFFSGKDQRSAISDSNNALGTLLGGNTRSNIVEAVRSSSALSAEDADTITGYVAPGVLGVMKRQMLNGAVLDNSDGIGQMLLGETVAATVGGARASVDHSVPKNAPRRVSTSSNVHTGSKAASVSHTTTGSSVSAGAGTAVAHAESSDLSWLFRWLLPVVLLGGLMLAGLRNCGPENRVAAVDTTATDGLQAQLASLTAERDEALGDRETAVAEIDRLKGELETASAATADTSELDAANAEIVSLKEQLAEPADTSELDAANAEIVSLKEQLAEPADTSELDAANAEVARLQNELANVPAPVDNTAQINSLQSSVDDGTLKIAQLESELGTVRSSRDELEQSIAAIQAEKSGADDRNTELKEKLLAVAGAKNRLEGDITGLQSAVASGEDKAAELNEKLTAAQTEVADAEATLAEQKSTLDTLTAERDGALDAVEQEKAKVTELMAEVDAASNTLEEQKLALASVEAERDSALGKIDVTQSNLDRAVDDASNNRKAAVAAQSQVVALQKSIADSEANLAKATEDLSTANASVADLEAKLKTTESDRDAAAEALAAAESSLEASESEVEKLKAAVESAEAGLAEMTQERDSALATLEELEAELAKVTRGRSAAISTVKDLAGKLRSSETTKQGLEETIAESEAAIQAKKDEVESVSTSITDRLGVAGVGAVSVAPVEETSAVAITMGSSDLYDVGSASLSAAGIEMLGTVGSIIGDYSDWRIDVEGHTDGQAIGSVLRQTYASNWELSVARAAAAVRYLQANVGIPADKLSVRGFGEHRPVDTNETAEGREANRRIELILRRVQ